MFKKLINWYLRLSLPKQFALLFLINGMYWFFASQFIYKLLWNERHTLSYEISHAVWMAFFMTMFFRWKKIVQYVRERRKSRAKI
jgi:hypothetical protein